DYLLKADGTPATTPATTRPATTSPQTSGSATAKASLTSPQSAPRASPVHATSKLSASPLPVTSWPGEHFPETRTRALTEADLQQWDFAKTRYALNEIYARHGFPFHSAPIRHQFETFSWYHPVTGRSQEQTEQLMSAVERANLKLLAHRRSH
ncbi:MAG: YARHG domain-containing protein, partial [Abitibacteriaceae bacterium]|nr:YARHG domain-containing protein [Abditibacteriaceae bacterium]